jgi:hypothetical protein
MRNLLLLSLCTAMLVVPARALAAPQTVPPTDIATGAAEPSETSARVVGYWNYGSTYPPGIPDQCWFDYGTTLAYGGRTTAICSGTSYATLTPLLPATTYHYRAAASNSAGTTYGPDKTFTTLASAPPGNSAPPPADVPGTSLKIVPGQSLASVVRRGLRLRLTLAGSCPCVVRARLLASGKAIASSRRQYGTPGTVDATLKLKRSAKRKLRHARVLRATLKMTAAGASGKPIVLSRSLKLRRVR